MLVVEHLAEVLCFFRDLIQLLVDIFIGIVISIFRCLVPEPKKSVRCKVVLITGAGQGLGRELAKKFGRLGAKVIVVDVNKEKNEAVRDEIKFIQAGTAYAYTCDVSEENQVESLASRIFTEVGPVNILINNAGVLPGQPFLELTSNQIRKTMGVNFFGHIWMLRHFLPKMLENGEGHIVAISSIAGMLGTANLVDYCASKHAVMGLMAALREELFMQMEDDIIQMTTICPVTMNTRLVQKPISKFPSLLPILDVKEVAQITTDAILRNKQMVVIPTFADLSYRIKMLLPFQVSLIIQRFFNYTIEPNETKLKPGEVTPFKNPTW